MKKLTLTTFMRTFIILVVFYCSQQALPNDKYCGDLVTELSRQPVTMENLYKVKGALNKKSLNHKFEKTYDPNVETVVFIHGLDDNLSTFKINIIAAENFNILRLDLRSHGKSEKVNFNQMNLASMAEDINNLLTELGIKEAHFVAHSMGSRVTAKLAQINPDIFKSIFFEDMDLHSRITMTKEYLYEVLETTRDLASKNEYESIEEIIHVLTKIGHKKEDAKAFAPLLVAKNEAGKLVFKNLSPQNSFIMVRLGLSENLIGPIKKLDVPMTFLRADPTRSDILSEEGLEIIEKELPNATIHQFPGVGHNIHREAKDEYNRILKQFLDTQI